MLTTLSGEPKNAEVAMVRFVQIPVFFAAGWLFNFVVDIKFVSGFAAGWFAHSWLAHTWLAGLW